MRFTKRVNGKLAATIRCRHFVGRDDLVAAVRNLRYFEKRWPRSRADLEECLRSMYWNYGEGQEDHMEMVSDGLLDADYDEAAAHVDRLYPELKEDPK